MNGEIIEHENPGAYWFWLKFWRIVIAGSQIFAGALGLYAVLLSDRGQGSPIFLLPFACLIGVSIAAGVALALNKPLGICLSIVAQSVQVPAINFPSFLYLFVCGPQFLIGCCTSNQSPFLGLAWGYTVSYLIHLGAPALMAPSAGADPTDPVVIGSVPNGAITGINLVPALAIIALILIRKQAGKAKI